jgi:hypothetical protein
MRLTIDIHNDKLWELSFQTYQDDELTPNTLAQVLAVVAVKPELFQQMLKIIERDYGSDYRNAAFKLCAMAAINSEISITNIMSAEVPVISPVIVKH